MSNVSTRATSVPTLLIDLTSGKVEKINLGMDIREKYLGGAAWTGLCSKLYEQRSKDPKRKKMNANSGIELSEYIIID